LYDEIRQEMRSILYCDHSRSLGENLVIHSSDVGHFGFAIMNSKNGAVDSVLFLIIEQHVCVSNLGDSKYVLTFAHFRSRQYNF
jgi:hypothetical protein